MPSRVLTGEPARMVEPIVWRKLLPGTGQRGQISAVEAFGEGAGSPGARIAELEREVEQREQQAFTAGFRKGEAAGQEAAAAALNPLLQRLAQTIAEVSDSRRKLRRDAEEDLVRLSLAIARRVLHRELSVDPEAIVGLVRAAFDRLELREVDRIRVHPDDAELLKRHLEQLEHGRFEVAPDPRLERGAVIFETAHGHLDTSIETQLQEIQRGLIDRIRH